MPTIIKNISQTDEYIKSLLTHNGSNIYNENNQFNEITAYLHVNRQLLTFLASGKGALFLIKQYLFNSNNKSSAFIYNPLSLVTVPGLKINRAFDSEPGNYTYDKTAKNPGQAKFGPPSSPTTKWGNVEQIKGPNGVVQPKGINDNVNDTINRALGVIHNNLTQQEGTNTTWNPKNTPLDDALKSKNEYYPSNESNETNKEILNINWVLFNNEISNSESWRGLSKKDKILNAKKDNNAKNDIKKFIIENHSFFQDVINQSSPIKLSDSSALSQLEGNDLINFYFETIQSINNTGEISYDERCYFRAYIESNQDSLNIDWDKTRDYGRVQSNVIYQGTDRSGELSFIIAIKDPEELIPTYKRLNWLITNLAYPKYADNLYISKPPFFKLTLGNIYNNVTMYANSISIQYYDKQNIWELQKGFQVPLIFKVNLSYGILYNGIPHNEIKLFGI